MNSNNIKPLIDLSTYQPIDFSNNSLAHLWERGRVRGATHLYIPPTKVKFAFTLAEVLITLGIIGVVAALTIPTLMQKYQVKRTVALLKEDHAKTCNRRKRRTGGLDWTRETWNRISKSSSRKIKPLLEIGIRLWH